MNTQTSRQRFWLVWCPTRGIPTRMQATRGFANQEATRLAQLNPGEQFFVLKAVGGLVCPISDPTEIQLRAPEADDQIPF